MLDRINRSADLSSFANYARSSPARGGGGGLSAAEIYQINQLDAVRKVGAVGLSSSASDFSTNFSQRVGGRAEVRISAAARIQSSLAEFNSQLQDLNGSKKKDPLKAVSTQPEVLVAKVRQGGKAQAAAEISVQQLAQSQQIQSQNFSPADAAIGTGKLLIQRSNLASGAQTASAVSININSSNNTLAGIAQAINASGANVRAAVVRDAAGSRLALTGDLTGQDQGFTVRSQDNDGNDTDTTGLSALNFNPQQQAIRQAQDAKLTINSRAVTSSNNTVEDKTSNLQLQLLDKGSAKVSLARDGATVGQKISDLVGRYNQARSQLSAIGDVAATKVSRALDESVIHLSVGSGLSQLVSADIGLSRDRSGKLFVNEARLSQQALAEPDALNDFFNLASSKLEAQLKTSMRQQGDYASALQGVRSIGAVPLASQSVASLLQSAGANFSLPINTRAAAGVLQYVSIAQLQ